MKDDFDYIMLGKRIAEWRKAVGLTQEALADILDTAVPYISEIENGKKKPSLNTVVSIADALGITVDELLAGNLLSDSNEYQSDIDYLLYDCSSRERRIIFETIRSLKQSLKQND